MIDKIHIQKGKILIYRVYDIGEEINLKEVEEILKERFGQRFKLTRDPKKAVIINNAPFSFSLGERSCEIGGEIFTFEVFAKIWSYGTLSLCFQYNLPECDWENLISLSVKFENMPTFEELARSKAKELTNQLKSAMKKTNEWDTYEDYTIYFLEKIDGLNDNALTIIDKENVTSLILSDNQGTISEGLKKNILEHTNQYYKNDLVIIDWNSALVIEPSGSMDVPDVIEFGLNQLLEMRYYDDLLDEKLATLYSAIETEKRTIFSDPYSALATEAGQTYIELSEIIETIENSFKVVGDFYLATIFRSANNRFRFNDWHNNVNTKLNNLAEISKVLQGEIHARRTQISEIIVILLIAFEVVPVIYKMIF